MRRDFQSEKDEHWQWARVQACGHASRLRGALLLEYDVEGAVEENESSARG